MVCAQRELRELVNESGSERATWVLTSRFCMPGVSEVFWLCWSSVQANNSPSYHIHYYNQFVVIKIHGVATVSERERTKESHGLCPHLATLGEGQGLEADKMFTSNTELCLSIQMAPCPLASVPSLAPTVILLEPTLGPRPLTSPQETL